MNISHPTVKAAVNSLIQSHPLFAGILIQQRFEADETQPTFSVDGEAFRFNPAFADSLSFDELKGVCAHEACHLAGAHHARQGARDPEDWNKACDYAINPRLLAAGLKLPKGALLDKRFEDKSAEDIYRIIRQEKQQNQPQPNAQQKPGKGQSQQAPAPGQGQGQGKPQSGQGQAAGPQSAPCPTGTVQKAKGDAKAAEAKAKEQTEKAMSIARIAGQLSAGEERAIKRDLAPRYDWREILHRFFQEVTARDYSMAHPSRRWVHTGLVLPSLRSRGIGRIVLAVDTSDSISTAEISAMVSEMRACVETYCESGMNFPLTVIYCDAEIQGTEELLPGDEPKPKGGGGTLFAPVFRHLQDLEGAACLVYLTDGYSGDVGQLADVAPAYPVLWGLIVDNEGFAPPFGDVCRVDFHA